MFFGPAAVSADGKKQATANSNGVYISPFLQQTTTSGASGYVAGGQYTTIEVQHIGNGVFIALSSTGLIYAF